jgi:hypothetical protein
MTETRAETLPETRTEKEEKKQKRLEKEQKRLEKEAKKKRKEEKRMEKEAAETLAQMSTSGEKKKSKKNKEPKIYPEDTIEAAETYCDACWREGEVVSVPNCREKCCTMNVCAYGCTFTCFMCEDSWRGTWKDRNDWFWAGYEDETFPVCPTCMPMVAGMPVSRSAAGLFPWTGLWPGVWLGCPTNC